MKALCIKEPWVQLILDGKKTIETRTWNTNYRGDFLICCSKKPTTKNSGKIVAIAEIYDCKPMCKEDEEKACCPVYDKAKSWFLRNIRPIKGINIKGQLGLFEIDTKDMYFIE